MYRLLYQAFPKIAPTANQASCSLLKSLFFLHFDRIQRDLAARPAACPYTHGLCH